MSIEKAVLLVTDKAMEYSKKLLLSADHLAGWPDTLAECKDRLMKEASELMSIRQEAAWHLSCLADVPGYELSEDNPLLVGAKKAIFLCLLCHEKNFPVALSFEGFLSYITSDPVILNSPDDATRVYH